MKATRGNISGFEFTQDALYNGIDSLNNVKLDKGVYLGSDGINIGGGAFRVSTSGDLVLRRPKYEGAGIKDTTQLTLSD